MAITEDITKLDSFREYLKEIGQTHSYQMNKCFACGLPAVWLYMKSIDQEKTYFDIVKKVKERGIWFKELFYLLQFTNQQKSYFPSLPTDVLNIDIPPEILHAQVEMPKPEFELAYAFTKEQLKETLKKLALPGKLIRLGDKTRAIALMQNDDGSYAVYHANNPSALQFKGIDKCVDSIMRIMGDTYATLCMQVISSPTYKGDISQLPRPSDLLQKLLNENPTSEQLQKTLYLCVQNDDLAAVKLLVEKGADPAATYMPLGANLLEIKGKGGKELSSEMIILLKKHGAGINPTVRLGTQLN